MAGLQAGKPCKQGFPPSGVKVKVLFQKLLRMRARTFSYVR